MLDWLNSSLIDLPNGVTQTVNHLIPASVRLLHHGIVSNHMATQLACLATQHQGDKVETYYLATQLFRNIVGKLVGMIGNIVATYYIATQLFGDGNNSWHVWQHSWWQHTTWQHSCQEKQLANQLACLAMQLQHTIWQHSCLEWQNVQHLLACCWQHCEKFSTYYLATQLLATQ